MAARDVLVLGGGFGGAACAVEAARLLTDEHRVTLVDRSPLNRLCGANPFLIIGASDGTTRSLEALADHGVRFVAGEIGAVATEDRLVHTPAGSLPYDYLVIALGARYDWDAVPGARDGHAFYDHDSAVRLQQRLDAFAGGRIAIGVAGAPIKCPPAPFETALLLEWAMRERGTPAEVHIAIPEPAPLAVAGPAASGRLREVLAERSITLHTGAPVVGIDGPAMLLGDGTTLDVTIPISVPAHRVPEVVAAAGLTDGTGWVPVDRATLETIKPNVFAIGDVNVIPVGDKAVPKAGVFAAGEGRTAARVIASRIRDTAPPEPYDGVGHCFVAFSGTEAAQVGGDFFAPAGPAVGLEEPSTARHRDKAAFETAWQSFAV